MPPSLLCLAGRFFCNMKRLLPFFLLLLGAAAIFWICTFKIMDRDFWWHVKAGEIMLDTHRLIQTDPFAFTRAGLPYLATHEWLAQIVLALIYAIFGPAGIILFRGIIASACVGLLLLLGRKGLFWNVLLAVWAIVITKGSFLERPQLFTFLFFALFLLLAFTYLDAPSRRARLSVAIAAVVTELLWVNMHGAAALLGCAVFSFLLLQEAYRWWQWRERQQARSALLLCITLILMTVGLVAPPNGFDTLHYLRNLMGDQTIAYIAEWQPREWGTYLADLWPFWLFAAGSLLAGRRHLLFNVPLLVAMAILSRQAFRHEILFVFACLATVFYQWPRSGMANRSPAWTRSQKIYIGWGSALLVLLLARGAYLRSFRFEQQDNLFGFGQFNLARGAYDFIEREHVTGNMFNTYGIGGYLIYRGHPDRKVFIDGRNVDYGMDFMTRTYAAGVSPQHWQELAERYRIDYALIDYDAIRQKDRLPYSIVLEGNPDWPLVYLDDWVAVYVKNSPANKSLIDRRRFSILTASSLQFSSGFPDVADADLPRLEEELRRMQHDNPEGIKATLALAGLALRQHRPEETAALARDALRLRPRSPEPHALLGAALVSQNRWNEAADSYVTLLKLVGDHYPDLDESFIADVFEKAGRTWRARYYRHRAGRVAPPSPKAPDTENAQTPTDSPPIANPLQDALTFNEQGLGAVEAENMKEAEKAFRTAIMLNPAFAEAWNNLCALLLEAQRNTEAVDACSRAIQANAEYADAHFNLALAYFRNGSLRDAEQEAIKAKKLGREEESEELLLSIQQKKF